MTQPTIKEKNIVLYADDDPDDLDFVKDAFRQYTSNVELVSFINGARVLSYLQNLPEPEPLPCLIILDINMPVLNGKEVLVQLRKISRLSAVPVVLFTTSSQQQDKAFAEKYNAGFITKPLDARQMDLIINQFVEHCADDVREKIRKAI